MNFKLPTLFSAVAIFAFTTNVFAQESPKYSYTEAFKPLFYPQSGTETRSASGQPGHKYWQNSADYLLNVSLNEANNELTLVVNNQNFSLQESGVAGYNISGIYLYPISTLEL